MKRLHGGQFCWRRGSLGVADLACSCSLAAAGDAGTYDSGGLASGQSCPKSNSVSGAGFCGRPTVVPLSFLPRSPHDKMNNR